MKGDPLLSPWVWDSGGDYLDRHITITVPFNETTRAIRNGIVVHRDPGCTYTKLVWDVPTLPSAKRLPPIPDGDTTFSAGQVRAATGFDTIDQLLDLQITAEP